MVDYDIAKDSAKVGAMVRHMTGDVAKSFQRTLKLLYADENGNLTKVGQICAKWHWNIVKYAVNPHEMRRYITIIQTCYDRKINLDKVPEWKTMLRIILPEEFLVKMNSFTTQVPKIAIMDDTHTGSSDKKKIRMASEVRW